MRRICELGVFRISLFAFLSCSSLQQLLMGHCHTTRVCGSSAHISPLYPCPPPLGCCHGGTFMKPLAYICFAYWSHMRPPFCRSACLLVAYAPHMRIIFLFLLYVVVSFVSWCPLPAVTRPDCNQASHAMTHVG